MYIDNVSGLGVLFNKLTAKNVPQQGAGGGNLVNVEAGIRQRDGVEDIVVHIYTALVVDTRKILNGREEVGWRESQVLFTEGRVPAFLITSADVCQEGLVQSKKAYTC